MSNKKSELTLLQEQGEAPEWYTEASLRTVKGGYLLEDETPRDMYRRVANASANRLCKPELGPQFFEILWKGWLGLATPVAANMGAERGLPISCFSSLVPDTVNGIFDILREIAVMSAKGGGTAAYLGNIRPKGSPITGGGLSNGVIPWSKIYHESIYRITQGNVRRGASALYLDIDHPDYSEFLKIRKATNDPDRHCPHIHQGAVISNQFMQRVEDKDPEARGLWLETLNTRLQTGEPYMLFKDNVNKLNPPWYKDKGLNVKQSNLCCLLEDELVTTKEGNRKIADLVGQTVEVWDGNSWIELSNFESKGFTNQLVIVTYADGSSIKTTLNHRFPLLDGSIVFAKDLKAGNVIQTHNLEAHGTKEVKGAYIKGFLVGDGTYTKDRPLLWLYSPKYVCQERLTKSADELEGGTHNTNVVTKLGFVDAGRNRKRMVGLTPYKEELTKWCREYKKVLPEDIWEWNLVSKLEFIAGVMDADGTAQNGKDSKTYQLASVNRSWLLEFQKVLKSVGIQSCLGVVRQAGQTDFGDGYGCYETQAVYRLSISSKYAYKLAELCQFSRLTKLKRNGFKSPYKTKDRHGIITKVEVIDVAPTKVFCCNVPTTGLFALGDGRMTGNSEIMLHTDEDHSLVCCLSSMNVSKYDEWKHTNAVYLAIYFLDGVMQEFIEKAKELLGFERALRFAEKSRALGLGVLGYHTYLQDKRWPFECPESYDFNKELFSFMRSEADRATRDLAKEYGEPEWCKGHGVRNSHLLACAPTVSNSIICGNVSAGIEPITAGAFTKDSAKGMLMVYNQSLKRYLQSLGKDLPEVWQEIMDNEGSVETLDFLSDEDKDIFKTAREIDQIHILKQSADRQEFVDQGQSLNLFFPRNLDSREFNRLHLEAWKLGLKSLYYCRSSAATRADNARRGAKKTVTSVPKTEVSSAPRCIPCEG